MADPSETEDRIYQQCTIQITPLEITHKKPQSHPNHKKIQNTILIKLGGLTEKREQLNKPMSFTTTVSYSKTLMKYYPLKGMIKIYDKCDGGTEMILGVGGFSTDDLLNQGLNQAIVDKEVGPVIVKLGIQIEKEKLCVEKTIVNKESLAGEMSMFRKSKVSSQSQMLDKPPQIQVIKKSSISSITSNSRSDIDSVECHSPIGKNSSMDQYQPMTEKLLKKIELKLTSSERFSNGNDDDNKSLPSLASMASITSGTESQFNREIVKKEMETIGEQLIFERKKIEVLEERVSKSLMKNGILKKKLFEEHKQLKAIAQKVHENLISGLKTDKSGNLMIINDSHQQQIRVSYQTANFFQDFKSFLKFMFHHARNYSSEIQSTEKCTYQSILQSQQESEEDSILNQIAIWESEKIKILQESQEKDLQIRSLKTFIREKKTAITSQENMQKRLTIQREQLIQLQGKISKSSKEISHLEQANKYFKEKQTQTQSMIYAKDNTIEHLGKLISNQNKEIERLNKENSYFKNSIQNSDLQKEQFDQEISNLNETIEQYKKKFGGLGNMKNRALQNEIKDCIRWIDSQARDQEFNQAEETMQSDFSHPDNFSEVIRSFEIDNLPLYQITGIRSELVKILDKVDHLLRNPHSEGSSGIDVL